MPSLIESSNTPLTLEGVAKISQTLAEDLRHVTFHTEGFSVEDYFKLDGNYLVEYVEGRLQILPMPDAFHQSIVEWLLLFLRAWKQRSDPDARARTAPFKVMLDDQRYREPDLCVMLGRNKHRRHDDRWDGADLVIEVVSESNREHDLVTKRADYAAAAIPEYWIVDPDARTVAKLVLRDGQYDDAPISRAGDTLASTVLPGFAVDVNRMFAEAEAEA